MRAYCPLVGGITVERSLVALTREVRDGDESSFAVWMGLTAMYPN